jgi:hypothetical protein
MTLSSILSNFLSAPVLFFFLGLFAVLVKSDLEVPPAIAKFFSLYLLFDIGIKGGEELYHSGFTSDILIIMLACIVMSLIVPVVAFFVLKIKLDAYNAGAIAATYGSVSAVTFATAQTYVASQGVQAGGYMVAGMAIMESPAIIMGLLLIRMTVKTDTSVLKDGTKHSSSLGEVIKEAIFNGSIVLLVGSLIIGYLAGDTGEKELHGFVKDIFKGMLALYLLDMGLVAGSRMSALKKSGFFLVAFAIITPIINAALGIGISYLLGMSVGDAFLFTILCASASYIAVPAAMRMAVPQANMSLLLPMALAVTFPFNIILGIPTYLMIIKAIWGA